MKSDGPTPVAIVGAGASGTILAAQLARRSIDTLLIEGGGMAGRGIAYSTTEACHLLNVPAEGMSAWAGEPNHFAERFAREGGDRGGFAERRLFGRYLGELLREATASGHVREVAASATAAIRDADGWSLALDDGTCVHARALALAVGNQEPAALSAFEAAGDRFVRNPWGRDASRAIDQLVESGGDALIVGTGLTMVDLALSLDARGYQGKIVALSRRGQVPRSHAPYEPAAAEADEVPMGSVSALWRWLRHRAAEHGWRAAIDSLRPHSHHLWQSLGEAEQRRFLRHARPWWDVHRHRIAPQVAATITRLIGAGRLHVIAGRILSVRPGDLGLDVDVRQRGAAEAKRMHFAFAFNCTGPLHAMDRTKDPLLRSLLDAGAARRDQLGIGLDVDDNARAAERLWALGPLTKGRYWEIIAVPDIRDQAAKVADDIERELGK